MYRVSSMKKLRLDQNRASCELIKGPTFKDVENIKG